VMNPLQNNRASCREASRGNDVTIVVRKFQVHVESSLLFGVTVNRIAYMKRRRFMRFDVFDGGVSLDCGSVGYDSDVVLHLVTVFFEETYFLLLQCRRWNGVTTVKALVCYTIHGSLKCNSSFEFSKRVLTSCLLSRNVKVKV
jgi:hypothetical protein